MKVEINCAKSMSVILQGLAYKHAATWLTHAQTIPDDCLTFVKLKLFYLERLG